MMLARYRYRFGTRTHSGGYAMARRENHGATMEDIAEYAKNLLSEFDLLVTVQLDGLHVNAPRLRVVVALSEATLTNVRSTAVTLVVMHGDAHIKADRMAAGILLTLSQAVAVYMDDPWNWTERHRRKHAAKDDTSASS
jgi:acetaldehyde dehydrogenase (acetylating)